MRETLKENMPAGFDDFIKQDVPVSQLLETLDSTLLHMVMLLKYEPLLLESTPKLYDTLYQLREFVKQYR